MSEHAALMMPISCKPYTHQGKAFDFVCRQFGVFDDTIRSRGAALLMEMGTGKTVVGIAVAGILYQFGKADRVLVVAPLSIRTMIAILPKPRSTRNSQIFSQTRTPRPRRRPT